MRSNLYDPSSAERHIETLGTDAGVMALANLSWVSWFLGNYPEAIADSERAISHARKLGHPHSLAYALCVSAAMYQGLHRPRRTQTFSEETIGLAEKHQFAYWIAWGTILRGWALAELGRTQIGLTTLRKGLSLYRATGAELFRSHSLCLIAEICKAQGRFDEGIALVDEAISSSHESGVHFYDAALFRVHGELFEALGDSEAAAEAFDRSLVLSTSQHAGSLRLKAAISQYRSQRETRREATSRAALAAAYQAVVQDFDTVDMIAARALLF